MPGCHVQMQWAIKHDTRGGQPDSPSLYLRWEREVWFGGLVISQQVLIHLANLTIDLTRSLRQ